MIECAGMGRRNAARKKNSHKTHYPPSLLHSFLRSLYVQDKVAAPVTAMLSNSHNSKAEGTRDLKVIHLQANLEMLDQDSVEWTVFLNLDEVLAC